MKKAVVVDLDGTLLDTNTFKDYISFVGKKLLAKCRLDVCISLVFWVGMRKFRFISHEEMKKHILRKSGGIFCSLKSEFVNLISAKVNADVVAKANEYRKQGYWLILSSAAPCRYAEAIAEKYGFDGVISTPEPDVKGWRENVREVKKQNTLVYLKEHDCELCVLMTDHHDDLPLLLVDKEMNVLVKPTEKTLDVLKTKGVRQTLL